ncbi:MAG TPA: undecaprenyl-diphosphatase UppP [Candidatus Aminicenantes bacterium]|nr:undecaprenyl-diphosphatase UppP [Candidatus Aminicenantes bacterium]
MSFLSALLIGLVQGLTEFLPVSSTAHMTLLGNWLGVTDKLGPQRWTAFMAVIQLGTLAAVLVYFSRDLWGIGTSFLTENILSPRPFRQQSPDSRMGWGIILGSIPIVLVGLLLKKLIEGGLPKQTAVIAGALIFFALLLWLAEAVSRQGRDLTSFRLVDAIVMGLGQVFSLIPGASRSGTTLTAGLLAGLARPAAARFSFLLSVPAVLGSGLFEFKESLPYLDRQLGMAYGVAGVSAFASGLLAIGFLLRFLSRHPVTPFVLYRLALGALLLLA